MKFYVIRHGQTPLNAKGFINAQLEEDLTELGVEQAKRAHKKIPKTIKHIYTSPMKRAHKTAKLLNKSDLPITKADHVREVNMGTHVGNKWDVYDKVYGPGAQHRHRTINYDYTPHGGESAPQVKKRVVDFLKTLKENHDDGEVLVVSHGGVIRTIYFLHHGKPLESAIENTQLFEFNVDKILSNVL